MSKTRVTFLLDRSGSMQTGIGDTIDAFNAYIDGLKGDGDDADINFSLLQFDSSGIEKTVVDKPVSAAPKLSLDNYKPGAATPLVDASYETIKAVERKVNGGDEKVVICIQTDGFENCSTDWSFEQLNALIEEKKKLGWQFIFMGAGIDAYAQAAKMGIGRGSTVSYDNTDRAATMAGFAATAANTRGFAVGASLNADYSSAQKQAAGDIYDEGVQPIIGQPAVIGKPSAKPRKREGVSSIIGKVDL